MKNLAYLFVAPLLLFCPARSFFAYAAESNTKQEQCFVDSKEIIAAVANLPQTLSSARAVPYFRDGSAVGIRLFAIRKESIWEKVGLRNGDILKAADDLHFTDPTQSIKIFESLKDKDSISLHFERNGEEKIVKYIRSDGTSKISQCRLIVSVGEYQDHIGAPIDNRILLKGVELKTAVLFLAAQAKREYISYPTMDGSMDLTVPADLLDEIPKILDTILLLKGFTSQKGKNNKWSIVPAKDAKEIIESLTPIRTQMNFKDGVSFELKNNHGDARPIPAIIDTRQSVDLQTYDTKVSGKLTFHGLPLSQFTDKAPHFTIVEANPNTPGKRNSAISNYNGQTGEYTISNLPPRKLRIRIACTKDNKLSYRPIPGCYEGGRDIDFGILTAKEIKDYDIPVSINMHLLKPYDNANIEYPVYKSPISFTWEPVTSAKKYKIWIDEYRDVNHPEKYGQVRNVKIESIDSTTYEAVLETSPELLHYQFRVEAYDDSQNVLGRFHVVYTNGFGWDYRFKAK